LSARRGNNLAVFRYLIRFFLEIISKTPGVIY